jgi:hypothetical protein
LIFFILPHEEVTVVITWTMLFVRAVLSFRNFHQFWISNLNPSKTFHTCRFDSVTWTFPNPCLGVHVYCGFVSAQRVIFVYFSYVIYIDFQDAVMLWYVIHV